jgi:hypothetical protein
VPPAGHVGQAGVWRILYQRLKRLDRRRLPRSPLRLAAPLRARVTRVGPSGMPASARITSRSSKDPGQYSTLFFRTRNWTWASPGAVFSSSIFASSARSAPAVHPGPDRPGRS